ncbi:MAG: DivIVA domain-containing protein, partial [Actinomycetota bacterium]
MSMTPREIHEKHFHDAFRGYNHEEVDSFLDEVAEAFERLYRDNQNLLRRVAELQEQSNRAPEEGAAPGQPREIEQDDLVNESLLKRMLVMAQETADKAVAEARQRANTLIENAQGRASQVEEQARERAERMIADAQRRLTELEESTVESRRRLEQAQEGLKRFDEEYRTQFKAFIESQLAALDHLPSSPEPAIMELPDAALPPPA